MPGALLASLTVRFDVVAIGAMAGLGYAVLATGLVLVYRFGRIINLAHGQIGAFAAITLMVLGGRAGLPYPVSLALAVATGAVIGVVLERLLIRPLVRKSRLAVLVATIGVTQILIVGQALMPDVIGQRYPVPVEWTGEIGSLVLHGEHLALLVLGPASLIGFMLLLSRTRYGLSIRAVADNRDAALLAGIDADRVARVVWGTAGALAAVASILTLPLTGATMSGASAAMGPGLLLRALAAGLVGRLTNVPRTIAAGIGIGVLEAVLFASYPSDLGLVDVVLFVAILGMLLLRSRGDVTEDASLSFGEDLRPLPERVRDLPVVRNARRALVAAGLVVALGAPFVQSSSSELFVLSRIPVFALIGLSMVVLTGWAGQLSLGQMAFVGLGALGTAALDSRGVPFGAAAGYMCFVGILIALAVGAPALRLKGLFLTVTTLALAVAASGYLLQHEIFRSSSLDTAVLTPGKIGPLDFDSYRVTYYLCLAVLGAAIVMARRLRRGGVGRALLAVEGNPQSAAAMTLSPAVVKLQAFAIAGALATIAGSLFAAVNRSFQVESFGPVESLEVLAMAVVGGIGSVGGAVLGALYLIGVPHLLGETTTVRLATSGIGLLVILRFEPGGLHALVHRVRDRLVAMVAPEVDDEAAAAEGAAATEPVAPRRRLGVLRATPPPGATPALTLSEISVTLGGRRIVSEVDLTVGDGEIVGLIGSNGAGKTTLMNAVSGFVPARGSVRLGDEELSDLAPHERARLGLGRSFQAARLYPRLTVRECVMVALESRHRTELVPSLLALPPAIRTEARARREADEVIALIGLGRYAESPVSTLSTGTRRLVELACLIAMEPTVILLDEPMAGIAQREAEAFGPLIVDLRRHLGAAMLVIEHDLPLISAISDRLYCLETGRVIASGTPEEVRSDPRVIASYLGTDERAIARSGTEALATGLPGGAS